MLDGSIMIIETDRNYMAYSDLLPKQSMHPATTSVAEGRPRARRPIAARVAWEGLCVSVVLRCWYLQRWKAENGRVVDARLGHRASAFPLSFRPDCPRDYLESPAR